MRPDAPADFMSHANRPARLVPVPTAIIVGAWFLFAAAFLSDAGLDLGPPEAGTGLDFSASPRQSC